ncbi:hypothetical protein GMDG_08710 [Pseudogymnoascus destructans 20631-21]|uniref:Uncharacterized protein n=1 Tax=Pseudogymnoascus destructans (strain ATCC MYA-4855 / 20631-21) TaxID=658429 RepID=L8G9X3_PSED2|nr:hypothetical protein GMDG_08710 [Pseudogymnoascus destructans 20631-21]
MNQRQARYDQKSQGEHGVFATQEGNNETSATLQNRTNNLQQGQQGWNNGKKNKDKADRGQPRTNQDIPVSFATAFQVTQGLSISGGTAYMS